jgi:exosortase E/protease (VPEID-CTERM system)
VIAFAALAREPLTRAPEVVRVLLGPFGLQFLVLLCGGTLVFGWTAFRDVVRIRRTVPGWLITSASATLCYLLLSRAAPPIGDLNTTRGFSWAAAMIALLAFAIASFICAFVEPAAWMRWLDRDPRAFAFGAITGIAGCFAAIAVNHWRIASYWTLRVVERLLPLFGQKFEVDAPALLIGTPYCKIYLAGACSGLEGMGIVAVFLVAYLWFCRDDLRFPAAFALVPFALIVVWLFNAVRIAMMIAIAPLVGDAMTSVFHSMAGWISLNLVALGIVLLSRRSALFTVDSSVGVYLLPLFFLMAIAFLTRFGTDGFDLLYGLRVLVVVIALIVFRHELSQFDWKPSWWAIAVGALVFAIWIGIDLLTGHVTGDPAFGGALGRLSFGAAIMWLMLRIVGAVITVPIAEELAFRGYLLRKMISSNFRAVGFDRFTWPSFLISSAIFGALHGRWIAGIIAGMLFALAAQRRGRFSDAVYAHATANALIAVLVLVTRNWSLWT